MGLNHVEENTYININKKFKKFILMSYLSHSFKNGLLPQKKQFVYVQL